MAWAPWPGQRQSRRSGQQRHMGDLACNMAAAAQEVGAGPQQRPPGRHPTVTTPGGPSRQAASAGPATSGASARHPPCPGADHPRADRAHRAPHHAGRLGLRQSERRSLFGRWPTMQARSPGLRRRSRPCVTIRRRVWPCSRGPTTGRRATHRDTCRSGERRCHSCAGRRTAVCSIRSTRRRRAAGGGGRSTSVCCGMAARRSRSSAAAPERRRRRRCGCGWSSSPGRRRGPGTGPTTPASWEPTWSTSDSPT